MHACSTLSHNHLACYNKFLWIKVIAFEAVRLTVATCLFQE